MRLAQSRFVFENAIDDGDSVFHLRAPIPVEISTEDGIWTCESKRLGILAFGPSEDRALQSFAEDFAMLWEQIAQAPDEDLTSDAVQLKRVLCDAVKSVDLAQ